MKRTNLIAPLCMYLLLGSCLLCLCGKVRKNKQVRNLLKSLTERVDTDDGENEYARLTQTPVVSMRLSKVKFKTSLQNVLVEPYTERVKDFVAKNNYEIRMERALLDEIKNANQNMNRIGDVLSARGGKQGKTRDNHIIMSRYFHYLKDKDEDFGLSFFPVYKTFKSNASHFGDNLSSSLYPHELLQMGSMSSESFLKNSPTRISFPERGDS
ncbi:conserved Plasmodium protein, unknown function [Plasmodium vivax]|uniref:Pv-fam-d protein n=2 Tax=Plasmodium vivax TaxID=5855 RepID=A0A0J9U2A8_PLAVI|nr:hypothetical protein PVNG_04951 [Plasmodium vivax North Korean]CAG9479670.1 unnamed protein product [Plasmodium vivax]SCO71226.1 conserved Plasmodium protein, unknown function [Plasmodium vivax]